MKSIILLGAPGAGKGTVAEELKEVTSYTHISTGDMLRSAVKEGSNVGMEAKGYMERGELVPDEVIIGIVRDRIHADGGQTDYMFDGFPRTLEQASLLDETLAAAGAAVDAVFLMEVPETALVERLSGRRVCRSCGAVYHVRNIPTRVEGICDRCGGETYQRADDNEETVLNRLDVFKKQTESLIDYYEQKGVLVRIDASKDKESTVTTMLGHLRGA